MASEQELEAGLRQRVFQVLVSAALPAQSDDGFVVPLRPLRGGETWVTYLGVPREPAEALAHPGSIRCDFETHFGTIDELVELYRLRLTGAAKALLDSPTADLVDHPGSVNRAQPFGYRPGRAVVRPLSTEYGPDAWPRVVEAAERVLRVENNRKEQPK